jgi:hypothetical protein
MSAWWLFSVIVAYSLSPLLFLLRRDRNEWNG